MAEMEIDVRVERPYGKRVNASWLRGIVAQAATLAGAPDDAGLSLVITGQEKVRALNDKLQRVRRLYPLAPPRQILKYMLSLKGIGNGAAVQPAAPLPAAVKQQVRTVLRREGSLD